jgi:hypothetical protein
MNTRNQDPEVMTMTRDQFAAHVRSGNGAGKHAALKEWLRLIAAIVIPLVLVILAFSKTSFQVVQNKEDIGKQGEWIESHSVATDQIKGSISSVATTQAVILEKIESMQKTIDNLN